MKQITFEDFGMPKKNEAVPYLVGHVLNAFVKKNRFESSKAVTLGLKAPITTTTRVTLTDILKFNSMNDELPINFDGFENAMKYLTEKGIFKQNKNGYYFTGNSYSTITIEKDLVPYFEKWKKEWLD